MSEDRSKGIDGHNPRGERIMLKKATLEKYNVDKLEDLQLTIGIVCKKMKNMEIWYGINILVIYTQLENKRVIINLVAQ